MLTARVAATAALILALGRPAGATEVTVKNDSIVNNGQAVIVGDFAAHEIAAARLTSPCAGTIVAVQVLWLSGDPGAQPTVEDAIYIWNGPNFPAPGTELAFLEGPALTPGYWNEFRYLDEAQTVPLAVPVTSGQQFYVGLQFYEGTDIMNGSASVVRDVNGCQAGKNSLFAIPGGWLNFCTYLAGDLAIRAVIDCPNPDGACCLLDGTCVQVSESSCDAQNGVFQGAFTTCAQTQCPQPIGACCFTNGNCISLSLPNCNTAGGRWLGPGVACNGTLCPTGACCQPDGTCSQEVAIDCEDGGGVFQGVGTQCVNVNCPQPGGACCFASGGCLVFVQSDCDLAGGSWKGPGTTCADNNSNGQPDACEGPAAFPGDCNCDGQLSFADINPFVAGLAGGAQCAPENFDINGDGSVDFGDINPFVTLLSSGPLPRSTGVYLHRP